jgi:hypothetical protein
LEEIITIRELMVLFHRSSDDADRRLTEVDNEEYRNVVMYRVDDQFREP